MTDGSEGQASSGRGLEQRGGISTVWKETRHKAGLATDPTHAQCEWSSQCQGREGKAEGQDKGVCSTDMYVDGRSGCEGWQCLEHTLSPTMEEALNTQVDKVT